MKYNPINTSKKTYAQSFCNYVVSDSKIMQNILIAEFFLEVLSQTNTKGKGAPGMKL